MSTKNELIQEIDLGEVYMDSDETVNFTNKDDFNHELSNKIKKSAKDAGYDAELSKDQQRVSIKSDKFRMSVPVKNNHAFAIINETSEYKKKKAHDEQATYDKLVKTTAKDLNEMKEEKKKKRDIEEKEQTKNDQEATIVKREPCGQRPIPVNNNEAEQGSENEFDGYGVETI